jgi:prepilin-type N-terminal cleavage/methylation domain-containing protein
MRQTKDRRREKRAFTIVELLTVMSIIVILISILVPALNKVRRYALDVKERAQLHAIGTGLEAFSAEFDGYPDSGAYDPCGAPYCGSMKLAEAMVGQDLKGFNPDSKFTKDGFPNYSVSNNYNGMPYPPYNSIGVTVDPVGYAENIKKRKTYLQLENANAYQMRDIWKVSDITSYSTSYGPVAYVGGRYDPNTFVLCDVYSRVTHTTTGRKIGMPILYYKADPTKTLHPGDNVTFSTFYSDTTTINPNPNTSIYNVVDNLDFVCFLKPWSPSGFPEYQPMANLNPGSPGGAMLFYQKIRNKKLSSPWPYRADTFILMSAGYDGEYGTGDDIFNFGE